MRLTALLLKLLIVPAFALAISSVDSHERTAEAHSLYVSVVVQHSGKCLAIGAGSRDNGAPAIQYMCAGYADQSLQIVDVDGEPGWHYIKFAHSGKCLTVNGNAWWDGATLDQWDCLSQPNQMWSGEFRGGLFEVHASRLNPTKCITVHGQSQDDGAPVNQWECGAHANQAWQPEGGCHPSYEGAIDTRFRSCIRRGIGDYDCAGGTGNGPNFAIGPFRVVGPDEFDLDSDHDGIGCESG